VVGFEDSILMGILMPGVIALVVICGLVTIADNVGTVFDVNLIDFFEIFWLISPVMFFVIIGLTTGGLTYELLANDWFDMIMVLAAAQ
jgi:uncharacterized membrane protein